MTDAIELTGREIAIVGMACRFPGARNLAAFWEILRDGREAITFFSEEMLRATGIPPEDYQSSHYIRAGTYIDDQDCFDAPFFGLTAREAALLDPQHRLFLQCAWEALEDATHVPAHFDGAIGVFAGCSLSAYLHKNLHARFDPYTSREPAEMLQISIGNEPDYLPTQVSYKLNLRGPSIAVQTACSTSLVAVHLATQSLLTGESDMALAGGATLRVPQQQGYFHLEDGPFSPDGHCRAFDSNAAGTVFGQGVGIVALRRLEDALEDGDHIYAVLKGTAINNDGAHKVGFTAPAINGQVQVITEAHAIAEVDPRTITYVEAHGTATPLGDPIEFEALTRAFGTRDGAAKWCALGSVKTNIGHTETAAGIAGLIKTALALHHKQLPPSLHFVEPNPQMNFERSPFYINTECIDWTNGDHPRRAGVSSFGFGGTNAHVVLEEAPVRSMTRSANSYELLTLSAKTSYALDEATDQLATHLAQNADVSLADIAFTLHVGREAFVERCAIVTSDSQDALAVLRGEAPERIFTHTAYTDPPPVVFLFPGGGAQYPAMGQMLYQQAPVFRQTVDHCATHLISELGCDLRTVLYADDREATAITLLDPTIALPALFITEYALAQQWMDWGIKPVALLGHSLGEYTAATLAQVLSLPDALSLVAMRARWMAKIAAGVMAVVPLAPDKLAPLLTSQLDIAAINGPNVCVVSGLEHDINQLEAQLSEHAIEVRRLHLTAGAHSRLVEPMMDDICRFVETLTLNPPQIPYISNVTGDWITSEQATQPHYWAEHLRHTVQFDRGLHTLSQQSYAFVEVGPGTTLTSLVKQHPTHHVAVTALASLRHPQANDDDYQTMLTTLGRLWACGVAVDWQMFHRKAQYRVSLPTYPFERRRYWIEPSDEPTHTQTRSYPHSWLQVPTWQEQPLPMMSVDAPQESWLIVGDTSAIGSTLVATLRDRGERVILVLPGDRFTEHDTTFTLRFDQEADYRKLFDRLVATQSLPRQIIYTNTLTDCIQAKTVIYDGDCKTQIQHLVHFVRTLEPHLSDHYCTMIVVTNHAQVVESNDTIWPAHTPFQAVIRIVSQEFPRLRCRTVDIQPSSDHAYTPLHTSLLLREATLETDNTEVAYRGRRRWVKTWMPLTTPNVSQESLPIREHGVYLITGGLGDLGLRLATHLASHTKVRLALLGRQGLPPESTWPDLLATTPDSHGAHQIRTVQQLRSTGTEILIVSADVSDRTAMVDAVKMIRRELGSINGVIHAAGIIGPATFVPLTELSVDDLDHHFAAKVSGTAIITELVRDEPLDFGMCMSSVATSVGGVGLAAYAAANRFMEAYTHMLEDTASGPWITVAWDGWRLGKMGEDTAQARTLMRHAMETEAALQMFDRVLSSIPAMHDSAYSCLVVSPSDVTARSQLDSIQTIETPDTYTQPLEISAPQSRQTAIVQPENDIEQAVCAIWSELLGTNEISRYDDFFELGGHSLLATQLTSRVRDYFDVHIRLSDLMRASTVTKLAELIQTTQPTEASAISVVTPNDVRNSEEERWFPFPLTNVQHAYWIGRSDVFELGNVACHVYFEFDCVDLDITRYNAAWNAVIARHDMLRAIVLPDGRQQVLPTVPEYDIPIVDLRAVSADEQAQRLQFLRDSLSHQMLMPNQWPLFDVRATRLDNHRTRIHLSLDVLICDAASFAILNHELQAWYESPQLQFAPLSYSFRDYILDEVAFRESATFREATDYWRTRLTELPPAPQLPTQRHPSSITTPRFERRTGQLDQPLWDQLQQRAAQAGITPTGVVLTAFANLLTVWSQSPHFTLNLTLFNRRAVHPDINHLIGDFTTLTLLEVDHRRQETFLVRARHLQQRLWEDLDHSLFSALDVLRELQSDDAPRAASMPIVFTSTLGIDETIPGGKTPYDWLGTQVFGASQTPQVWLDHQVFEMQGSLCLNWDSVKELFPQTMLDTMLDMYVDYLERLATEDDMWDQRSPDLVPMEHLYLIDTVNATVAPLPEGLIHDGILGQAYIRPNAPAVLTSTGSWNYRTIAGWSGHVAACLQDLGVQPGQLIPIIMEKGVEQVIGVVAALRAGGAYLPIDPTQPPERLRYLLSNAHATVALVQPHLVEHLTFLDALELIPLDVMQLETLGEAIRVPTHVTTSSQDLAYVIYTSGSTGEPKGVMIDHHGALNTIVDINQRFDVDANDRVLGLSALNFDLSVWDIFGMLSVGGALVLPDPDGTRDPAHWQYLMQQHRVTVWNSVPALMEMLVEHCERVLPSNATDQERLRLTLLSGDWIPLTLPERIRNCFPRTTDIVSLGGATEASIWSILYPITSIDSAWTSIPYGRPMQNQSMYVLDDILTPRPCWVTGELYIEGVGVAQGYWGDAEKTAERFITHPTTRERLYRTGDLGRLLPDGNIEFLGRADFQVKVGGHRIELGEIETALLHYPMIREAVAIAADDQTSKRLLAYVVPDTTTLPATTIEPDDALEAALHWPAFVERCRADLAAQHIPSAQGVVQASFTQFGEVFEGIICNTFRALGCYTTADQQHTPDTIVQQRGVAARYTKWLHRGLEFLVHQGYLSRSGDMYIGQHPLPEIDLKPRWEGYRAIAAEASDPALLELGWLQNIPSAPPAHLENLAAVLTETVHSAEIYASEETEASYRFFHYANTTAQSVLQTVVETLPKERTLRILEVGAGFGTTTKYLLPMLRAEQTYYAYTDVSTYFLKQAREAFTDYTFMDYALLDIERDPQIQGFARHSFDIVIASSVVHATRDIRQSLTHLRSLLNAGGLLLLLEETRYLPQFVDVGMGLQQGFERFEDTNLRQLHALLSWQQWHDILLEQGYQTPERLTKTGSISDFFGLDIIIARGPRTVYRFETDKIQTFLGERLPEYMIPAAIVTLDTLPLTINGKVDRTALPLPDQQQTKQRYRAPRNLVEQQLAEMWCDILGIERAGLDDTFFRLGGDSLLVVRMVAHVREQFGVELSLRHMFARTTLEALAATIQTLRGTQIDELPTLHVHEDAIFDPFPLADLQEAYWVGQQQIYELSYRSAHFYIDFATRHLDLVCFEQALNQLCQRQPMLRCVMLPDGQQRILRDVPHYQIPVIDMRHCPESEVTESLRTTRTQMFEDGPDTIQWPLFDLRATLLDEGVTRIHLSCSLLIADGWSFYIFFYELFSIYEHPEVELPTLDVTFRDYVLALQELKSSAAYTRAQSYWWERLPYLPPAPQLPLAHEPATLDQPRLTRRSGMLTHEQWDRLKQHCTTHGLTISTVLGTLYAEVLACWSRSPHFTLNMLYFNRLPLHPHLERILGPFSTTALVEVDLTHPEPLVARARRMQAQLGDILEYGLVSGVEVLREMARQQGGSARPLMPVVFTSTVGFESEYMQIPTEQIQIYDVYERVQTPQIWLDYQAFEEDGTLAFNWDAVEELFPVGMLDTMFDVYQQRLRRLIDTPEAWERHDEILVPAEQLAERVHVNATEAPLPEQCLHQPFEASLLEHPDEVAVQCGNTRLTYTDLQSRTTIVASHLSAADIQQGELVAVVMEKGWEQIVAVLGIHTAGAAYLPIDPAVPASRLHYLLENGRVRVALTQPQISTSLDWPDTIQRVVIRDTTTNALVTDHAPRLVDSRSVAYVIYTSGSTGTPKGVTITHRSALNTIVDINHRFDIGQDDRVLGLSALNFDLSVYDIFGTLAAGGTLVLPEPSALRDPSVWCTLMEQAQVTVWNSVPALMELLINYLDTVDRAVSIPLRLVLLSGDWIPVQLPERIHHHFPDARVTSLGGATEASIWSIYYPISEVDPTWRSIPYGRPLTNQTFHVLNASMQPCPVWTPGELHIGGEGVALGYWHDEQRTREQFVVHPETGERLYRTGDIGRYLPGGDIEFLGREDTQVKVHGYRIELGEIEAVLEQHPLVRTAVVVVQGEHEDSRRLSAYIVPATDHESLVDTLREYLAQHLPTYMHPTTLHSIAHLPLTLNGKVDRSALAAIDDSVTTDAGVGEVAPRTTTERALAEVWQSILDVPNVGVTDNFFRLGGNSLMAVRLLGAIEQRFSTRIAPATLFQDPTIAALAQDLGDIPVPSDTDPTMVLRSGDMHQPFFCIHPSGGDVLCYAALARLIDHDRPIIGIQEPALLGEALPTSIPELAQRYLRAIRRWQPNGPYLLGGWSLGGTIAYEMAVQLDRAGERVSGIAMFDSNAPSMVVKQTPWDDPNPVAVLTLSYIRSLETFLNITILNHPETFWQNATLEERIQYLSQRLKQIGLVRSDASTAEVMQRVEIFCQHIRVYRAYQPPAFQGNLLLVRATDRSPSSSYIGIGVDDAFNDLYLGWQEHMHGQMTLTYVAGHHYSILRTPGLEQLAEALNQWLHNTINDKQRMVGDIKHSF
ncbi:MAG: hypothetical protein GFH27_549391n22 [Chloroflexi bacterium AL-W]|nr:hypothetical protein [Chloroflexi bacterium AL-N1]NOK71335.1 hypothetical protein [Chloroflexi bacterium AL-N10]NOK78681.1 hypothetical protein [Chloroflexi bacterium AL-N5]NOK85977.1 hypothetical protein [Chloroflexi bacterium AL-W]NOK93060.1 hypothetical protein [Chloroflexi bacterium AL-N15]